MAGNEIRTHPQPRCCACGTPGLLIYQGLKDLWYGTPGEWNIKKCANAECGMAWLDPMPTEEDIGCAYQTYYTHGEDQDQANTPAPPHRSRGALLRKMIRKVFPWRYEAFIERGFLAQAFGYTRNTKPFQRVAGYTVYLLLRRAPHLSRSISHLPLIPGGRLLDIGCGDGAYLEWMRKLGWEVEGVEVDPQAADAARRRGLVVHGKNLQAAGFEDGRFDAVVLTHVLEHVHDPEGLLRECYRVLRVGGIIRVLVPNIASYGHHRLRTRWPGLDPPRHLYHFTIQSLKKLAVQAGFNVEIGTSSAWAEHMCKTTTCFATQKGEHSVGIEAMPTRVELFLFGLRESAGNLLGKQWGEEIVLKGTKRAGAYRSLPR